MTELWSDGAPGWQVLFFFLVAQLVLVLVLRIFPGLLSAVLTKKIASHYDAGLERLRADLNAKYSTLDTAVAYLSASHNELRSKRIEAAESLWTAIRTIENEFRQATTAQSLFLPKELHAFFSQREHPGISTFLGDYKDLDGLRQKMDIYDELDCERHRLFSGERLWLRFEALWRAHGRIGWLVIRSFEESVYVDWRDDHLMNDILLSVLSVDVLTQAKERRLGGFNHVLGHLRACFLKEAARITSGSPQMANDLSDTQATLLAEQQRIRSLEEEPRVP